MLKALKKYRAPYLFIMPFFILFQLVPTIWTFYISLTNWKGIGTPDFCGFDNYRKMLIDDMFWESLGNTVVYWLTGLVFIICCALLIASLLNSRYLKSNSARAFFKTATFLPNICAAIAMGLIFRMLFDENVGLVNEVVRGQQAPLAYQHHIFKDTCYYPECLEIYTMVHHDSLIGTAQHIQGLL